MAPVLNQNTVQGDYTHKEDTGLESSPDAVLFSRIGSGDESALAELYQRYKAPLFRFLVNLVADTAAAEELLQDVFIAAWQRADSFRGASSVKTWLFSVAHKRAASWLARKRSEVPLDWAGDLHADEEPLPYQAFLSWQQEEIQRALQELSPKHRAAIDLFFFHGLSYKEVAGVVGCPVGTAKSRVSYGLRSLYMLLSEVR
jgi:RNA polymerase sigma-70 factor (ECF subfamily)